MQQFRSFGDGHFLTKHQHIADKAFAAVAFTIDKRKIDPSDITAVFALHPIGGENQKNLLSADGNQPYLSDFVSEFDDLPTSAAGTTDQSVIDFSMEKNLASGKFGSLVENITDTESVKEY